MATFVDRVTLHLSAGDGGNGCVSVRREKFKPLAGPDGGNGGDGGDIVLVADPQVTTLLGYHRSPHRSSKNGQPGMGDMRSGISGETLELPVPIGTVVHDERGEVLADMTEPACASWWRRADRVASATRRSRRRSARHRVRPPRHPGGVRRRQPRAEDDRRRRARRLPECRQVLAHRGDLRREAEDRRLPVHDPHAEPRCRRVRLHPFHRRRRPRSHRGRVRGQGPRTRVPPPRRALRGPAARHRLRDHGPRS